VPTTHPRGAGAGAAAPAAAVKMRDRLRGRTVACVMSGGNIDQGTLARLLSTADCRLQIAD
jgi:threonine dehydratase